MDYRKLCFSLKPLSLIKRAMYSDNSIKSTVLIPFRQYILAMYCQFGLSIGTLNRVIRVLATALIKLSFSIHSKSPTRSFTNGNKCFVLEHCVFKRKQLRRLIQDCEWLEILGFSHEFQTSLLLGEVQKRKSWNRGFWRRSRFEGIFYGIFQLFDRNWIEILKPSDFSSQNSWTRWLWLAVQIIQASTKDGDIFLGWHILVGCVKWRLHQLETLHELSGLGCQVMSKLFQFLLMKLTWKRKIN